MEKKQIDEVVNYFAEKVKEKLSDKVQCISLFGSYARGDYSKDRPDVNLGVYFKERFSPQDAVILSDVIYNTIEQFKNKLTVLPEPRPFAYPEIPKGVSNFIFLNICPLSIGEKNNPFLPFGVDITFLSGVKAFEKELYGTTPLKDFKIKVDINAVKATTKSLLPTILLNLLRLPLAKNFYDNTATIFNESMSSGKGVANIAIEAAMTQEEFDTGKHLSILSNKEEMIEFCKKRYDAQTANWVNIILSSRKNFLKWKDDPEKAKEVYTAAFSLVGYMMFRLNKE